MDKKTAKKPKKAPKQKRARAKAPKKPKPIVIYKEAVPKKPCCTDVSKTGSGYQIPLGYSNLLGTARLGQPEQTPYPYLERLRNVEKAVFSPKIEIPQLDYVKVPIVENKNKNEQLNPSLKAGEAAIRRSEQYKTIKVPIVEKPEFIRVPIAEPPLIQKPIEASYVPLPIYEKAEYSKSYEMAAKPAPKPSKKIPVAEPTSEYEGLPVAYATDYFPEFENPSPFQPEAKPKRKYVRKTPEQKEAEAMKKEEARSKRIEKKQAKALGK
jgi:hypothetical protein